MKYIRERLSKANINFYKVLVGIAFSLLWGQVMYSIWDKPSFVTFVWFYLVIGSTLLKWGLFEIVDRINLRVRVRNMQKELDEAKRRRCEFEPKGDD